MSDAENISIHPPTAREIATAVDVFLCLAYDGSPPESAERFHPPADCDPAEWLMSDVTERSPVEEPIEQVRSFAMRIGNSRYPHMKLRLSRPPNDDAFVFTVDAHDAMLKASRDSIDHEELEALKRHNARVAEAIVGEWERAGLLTEHDYLRRKMRQLNDGEQQPSSGR